MIASLDFVQAAHELFRRRSSWHRSGAMVRGLYVGMGSTELRAYMQAAGDYDDVRDVEDIMQGGEPFQTERPSSGHLSTYHLSLESLVQADEPTDLLVAA